MCSGTWSSEDPTAGVAAPSLWAAAAARAFSMRVSVNCSSSLVEFSISDAKSFCTAAPSPSTPTMTRASKSSPGTHPEANTAPLREEDELFRALNSCDTAAGLDMALK